MKPLLIFLMLFFLVFQASAETCPEVLKKCDAALQAQIELNQLKDDLISNLQMKTALQDALLEDKNRELNAWYRDPVKVSALTALTLVLIGFTTGAIGGK